ncbi:hypothetical protein PRZ48_006664 [Zasmidium cellare]|uniref:Heterokaryon incompatibility domain-containing protein n=1 Tax=Zasmidium cellare TaxID=395010 RepID=A0ABR0ENQ4_ZASCE|nr:hypothetical protein PRZ48_006664 [Zasmidium cellare]
MRLINARTLQLEEFVGGNIPPFFILSHRWSNDEITFKDFVKGRRKDSLGYKKIRDCCEFVLRQHSKTPPPAHAAHATNDSAATALGFYVWIDTCCIDKRSSAELSEAINSMFSYYRDAGLCLVYLPDVCAHPNDSKSAARSIGEQFAASSWFTRGWTLQELLAPKKVVFLDSQWRVIGHKGHFPPCNSKDQTSQCYSDAYTQSLALDTTISRITKIDPHYLYDPNQITYASIAQRMSWAAKRTTLRIEDTAYCLLGLFDVNMPLLYGEGPKAFIRLQEELIRKSNDQSIFAWWPPADEMNRFNDRYKYFKTGILAPHPQHFQDSSNVASLNIGPLNPHTRPYAMTNSGLELCETIRRATFRGIEHDLVYAMRLNCAHKIDAVRLGPPIQIAFWHVEPGAATTMGGYNRLVGAYESLLEEEEMIEGGGEQEEEEERVLVPKLELGDKEEITPGDSDFRELGVRKPARLEDYFSTDRPRNRIPGAQNLFSGTVQGEDQSEDSSFEWLVRCAPLPVRKSKTRRCVKVMHTIEMAEVPFSLRLKKIDRQNEPPMIMSSMRIRKLHKRSDAHLTLTRGTDEDVGEANTKSFFLT